MIEEIDYLCDQHHHNGVLRPHLICVPYSIENLHRMAVDLGIHRCWFHKDHYDIPIRRTFEIMLKCQIIPERVLFHIVRNPYVKRPRKKKVDKK